MKIVATTGDGYLIEATQKEVEEILSAVTGIKYDQICIGQKIAAVDYADTIKRVKALSESPKFKNLLQEVWLFNEYVEKLKKAVENVKEVES
ncbi:MAG: hypothetical protein B1H40_00130 [Candidatus Latescibacteria bacterium 4484_181]|nr:MAG: hypothetical protein B1H40_00130 [Candidatus Latescibacteria bacterium 4484_181]